MPDGDPLGILAPPQNKIASDGDPLGILKKNGVGTTEPTNGLPAPTSPSSLVDENFDFSNPLRDVAVKPPTALQKDMEAVSTLSEQEKAQKAELPVVENGTEANNFGMQSLTDIAKNQMAQSDNTKSVQVNNAIESNDTIAYGKERQKASEAKKEKAIENTAAKFVKDKSKIGSTEYEAIKSSLRKNVEDGDATVGLDKDGNPGLRRTTGFFEGLVGGWKGAKKSEEDADKFVNQMTVQERVDYLSKQPPEVKNSEYIGEKAGVLGATGEFMGGAAPFLGKVGAGIAIGTAAVVAAPETLGASLAGLPVALSFLFSAPDMANQGAMGEIVRRYQVLKKQQPEKGDIANMEEAGQGALAGGIGGIVTNAILTGGGTSALSEGSKSVIKKALTSTVKAGVHMGGAIGAVDLATQIEANVEGVKSSPTQMIEHSVDAAVENAKVGMLLHGLTMVATGAVNLPKVVRSAFKYGVKDVPAEEIQNIMNTNEAAGIIPEGTATKVIRDLNSYRVALSKTFPGLNDETKASVAGLIQKRDELLYEQENKDASFKDIYQQQIDTVNGQISEIVKTNKPFDHEVDDISGEPLNTPAAPDLLKDHRDNPAFMGVESDADKLKLVAQQAQNISHDGKQMEGDAYQSTVNNFGGDKAFVDAAIEEGIISSVNPTGGVFADYTPEKRMALKLGENITTLDKTDGGNADDIITIYRGVPKAATGIVAGDYITTNKQLAKDYAGTGKVVEKQVRKGDLLDDKTEPLGEEYIYRPTENKKVEPVVKGDVTNVSETKTKNADLEKLHAENIHAEVVKKTPVLNLLGGEESTKDAKKKVAAIIAKQSHIGEADAKDIYKRHENIRNRFEKLKSLIKCP